jgi:ectoine hydroxylase-related dioxygenase (phytanoyl-CoA dioxygenase family)
MKTLEKNGYFILKNFVENSLIDNIKREIQAYTDTSQKYGIRNADKKFSSIASLVSSALLLDKATEILGAEPHIVRVIYFDKTQTSNWLVPWHQDRTIAVKEQKAVKGWGKWSKKDGIPHVQPSLDILEKMITFRVHLDDSDKENGCLKVIPKSHHLGLLTQTQIQDIDKEKQAIFCEVKKGDILIMKPHILHASSKCLSPSHRRIVHIEYSYAVLPCGLAWANHNTMGSCTISI